MALYNCAKCGKNIIAETTPTGWEPKWKHRPEYGRFSYSVVWECAEHEESVQDVQAIDLFG